jgi:hypothetical protein
VVTGDDGRSAINGRSIDDIPLGLRTRTAKTVSESDVYLFAGITGDCR